MVPPRHERPADRVVRLRRRLADGRRQALLPGSLGGQRRRRRARERLGRGVRGRREREPVLAPLRAHDREVSDRRRLCVGDAELPRQRRSRAHLAGSARHPQHLSALQLRRACDLARLDLVHFRRDAGVLVEVGHRPDRPLRRQRLDVPAAVPGRHAACRQGLSRPDVRARRRRSLDALRACDVPARLGRRRQRAPARVRQRRRSRVRRLDDRGRAAARRPLPGRSRLAARLQRRHRARQPVRRDGLGQPRVAPCEPGRPGRQLAGARARDGRRPAQPRSADAGSASGPQRRSSWPTSGSGWSSRVGPAPTCTGAACARARRSTSSGTASRSRPWQASPASPTRRIRTASGAEPGAPTRGRSA